MENKEIGMVSLFKVILRIVPMAFIPVFMNKLDTLNVSVVDKMYMLLFIIFIFVYWVTNNVK